MLPVGRHVITASNPSLGYETTTTMQIAAGSVARVKLDVPSGVLNVNALPWADVTIDGKRLGPTPLGNVSLPIGSHEIVFTHPQLGERRQTVVVTMTGPNRVSVDLNQR
jgi:serine/threonine-protein kinase